MTPQVRIARRSHEITLTSVNGGRGMLALLLVELAVFGTYFANLAAAVGLSTELIVPLVPSLAFAAWTASLIKPDVRIVMNLVHRTGLLTRIDPIAGAREVASFSLDDVECFALRQIGDRAASDRRCNDYVVDLKLRGGERHELSGRGSFFTCKQAAAQLAGLTGIVSRTELLPAI